MKHPGIFSIFRSFTGHQGSGPATSLVSVAVGHMATPQPTFSSSVVAEATAIAELLVARCNPCDSRHRFKAHTLNTKISSVAMAAAQRNHDYLVVKNTTQGNNNHTLATTVLNILLTIVVSPAQFFISLRPRPLECLHLPPLPNTKQK